MTRDELKRMFPHMPESGLARNATDAPWEPKAKPRRSLKEIVLAETLQNGNTEAHRIPESSKSECAIRNEPFQPAQGKAFYPGRVLICFTCYRRRSLDTDNICIKWFLDAARYSGLIRDDRPEDVELKVSQEKVKTEGEERTEITITPINK